MASISVSPSSAQRGTTLLITGDGFTVGSVVTVAIPELGLSSEIVADAAGFFGTDDVADHASITLTSDATIPTANDTVTIDSVVYTYKATVTTTAGEVLLGATAAAALANLKKAINLSGVGGTDYGSLTVIHPTVTAGDLTATTLKLFAKTGGTAGNSLGSTEGSTHLSFPGATFNSGTPGSAASGVSAIMFAPEEVGTLEITATDGTNSASTVAHISS